MAEPTPQSTIIVQPPTTAMQSGAQTASKIATALGAQPIILAVVLLNIVFAVIGGYFLLQLEKYRASNVTGLIELMRACILDTAPLPERQSQLPIPDWYLPNEDVTRS